MWNLLKYLLIIVVWIIALTIPAITTNAAPNAQLKESIDVFVTELMSELDVETATSIAVVKGQQIIYQNSFGYADIENKIPATNQTLFYIASITKPIFALTVLQALEKSDYSLESTLAEMFPEIVFEQQIQANKITIRDLLTHTSGLDDNLLASAVSISGVHTPSNKLAMLAKLFSSKESRLGEFDYTNLGYNIVSIWYEKNFAQSWKEGVKQSVFQPLKMNHSSAYISDVSKSNWQLAKPYYYFNENPDEPLYLEKKDNTMHAAGGIITTTSDMASFLKIQLQKNKTNQQLPIPSALIELSQQPVAKLTSKRGGFSRSAYGYGWYIGDYKSLLTYHHFGAFDGFRPHFSFIPEKQIGLIILNNENALNDKVTDLIADFIYSQLLNESDVEKRLADRVKQLKLLATGYRKKVLEKEQAYKAAPWQLSLKEVAYVGIYHHPLAGNVEVKFDQGQFDFIWGNLRSFATSYNKKDIVRIKFRPTSPQLAKFELVDDKVITVEIDGIIFRKTI